MKAVISLFGLSKETSCIDTGLVISSLLVPELLVACLRPGRLLLLHLHLHLLLLQVSSGCGATEVTVVVEVEVSAAVEEPAGF